jgi:hypothetical protein
MIKEDMKIDMNNKTVTVGNVVIDMAGGIITIGAEEIEEVEGEDLKTSLGEAYQVYKKVGVGHNTPKTCSRCGMMNSNIQTCLSTFDEETGEWTQKHRGKDDDGEEVGEQTLDYYEIIPHKPITAEQKAQFKSERRSKVGKKVMIESVLCTVTEHIKGTLYKVKAVEQRPSSSGGLPTTVNVMRYASHNKSKNLWSWWENRGGEPLHA